MVKTSARSRRIFQLLGEHPALDLVNTLDWRFRAQKEELLESYDDLLAFVEQSQMLTAREAKALRRNADDATQERVLRETRRLREALAAVLYAEVDGRTPDAEEVEILERFFRELRKRERLTWKAPGLTWDWKPAEMDLAAPLWRLVRGASELLLSQKLQQLRDCGSPECRWLFLDTSKNHTRRWCDMKVCGNRMKARRFRAKQTV